MAGIGVYHFAIAGQPSCGLQSLPTFATIIRDYLQYTHSMLNSPAGTEEERTP